jgi:DNA-binding CsgD family transcriptional regulator
MLIEREGPRRRLGDLAAAARSGRGSALVLRGPAGVGKTALLHEVTSFAVQGMIRLQARGLELEQRFPWSGVRQLFEPAIAAETERPFSGAAAAAARIVRPGDADPGSEDTFAMVHALYWLTVDLLADGPALVTVDDLHWLDEPSVRFLAYLAARVGELPLLLVMATRPHDDAVISAATRQPGVVELAVSSLTPGGTESLLCERLGTAISPAFAAAAHGATGGNPLLLGELVAALQADGVPPTDEHVERVRALGGREVSHLVRDRMVRLSPGALACAEAVAILGEAPPAVAFAVARLDDTEGLPAADSLVHAGVLGSSSPLAFVHPLLRGAVIANLTPARRVQLHARAARVLRRAGAAPGRCAAHWLEAPGIADPEAAATLAQAGSRAVAEGAPAEAARYLSAALEAVVDPAQRADLLGELGSLQARLGLPEGIPTLEDAIAAAADPTTRALLSRELAARLIIDTRWDDAALALRGALAQLGDTDHDLRLFLEADLTALRAYGQLVPPQAPDVEGFTGATPAERCALRTAAFACVGGDGSADDAARLLAAVIDSPQDEVAAGDAIGQWQILYILALAERFDEADRLINRLEYTARERGLRPALALHLFAKGHVALRAGRLRDSLAWGDEGRMLAGDVGLLGAESICRAVAAEALIELGNLDEAAALLGSPVLSAHDYASGFLLMASARLLAARADHAGVIAATGAYLDRESAGRARNPAVFPARSLGALAIAADGDMAEAIVLVDRERDLARRFGAPGALAVAERTAGLLRGGEEGLALLRSSVARLEHGSRSLELARSQVALGAALRRINRREDARRTLRAGLELASRIGAEPLVADARSELLATGLRMVRRPASGAGSLTPSERRVALLAAAGRNNREIAQSLFVTLRTVETHLTHAYQKLGIRSRAQLAETLAT